MNERIFTFDGSTIRSIAISPIDTNLLAVGLSDGSVRICDRLTNNTLKTIQVERGIMVDSVVFSSNGKELLAGMGRSRWRLWNFANNTLATAQTFQRAGNAVDVVFSPDNTRIAAIHEDGVVISTIRPRTTNTLACPEPSCVAYSADGRHLACGTCDALVVVWDMTSLSADRRRPYNTMLGHTERVYSVAFPPNDSSTLASASGDGSIRFWNVETCLQISIYRYMSPIYSISFAPRGTHLASSHMDDSIHIWSVKSVRRVRRLLGHKDGVFAIIYSPCNNYLLSASSDATARVWPLLDARLPSIAIVLMAHNVAPYVVLDVLDFYMADVEQNTWQDESEFHHFEKIRLLERLRRRLRN